MEKPDPHADEEPQELQQDQGPIVENEDPDNDPDRDYFLNYQY